MTSTDLNPAQLAHAEAQAEAEAAMTKRVAAINTWRFDKSDANKAAMDEATATFEKLDERADILWLDAYDNKPLAERTPEQVSTSVDLGEANNAAYDAYLTWNESLRDYLADKTEANTAAFLDAEQRYKTLNAEAERLADAVSRRT